MKKAHIKRILPIFPIIFIIASLLLFLTYISKPQLFSQSIIPTGTVTLASKPTIAAPVATKSAEVKPSPTASATPSAVTSIPSQAGRSVRVPILTYHYIGNNPNPEDKARDNLSVAPDLFEEHMKYIATSGYNAISLDTMYAALKGNASLPPKPVIITFDDGYIDFYLNAYQVLRKYNLHATVFIPTGLMDQGYYLHWSQIQEMDQSGLISFQAHTVNHLNLITLPADRLTFQLSESKKILEQRLGKPVNFMAYPYGTSNATVWEAAKRAGYLGAAGTWTGSVISEGTIYDMPRIKIGGGTKVEDFSKKF